MSLLSSQGAFDLQHLADGGRAGIAVFDWTRYRKLTPDSRPPQHRSAELFTFPMELNRPRSSCVSEKYAVRKGTLGAPLGTTQTTADLAFVYESGSLSGHGSPARGGFRRAGVGGSTPDEPSHQFHASIEGVGSAVSPVGHDLLGIMAILRAKTTGGLCVLGARRSSAAQYSPECRRGDGMGPLLPEFASLDASDEVLVSGAISVAG